MKFSVSTDWMLWAVGFALAKASKLPVNSPTTGLLDSPTPA